MLCLEGLVEDDAVDEFPYGVFLVLAVLDVVDEMMFPGVLFADFAGGQEDQDLAALLDVDLMTEEIAHEGNVAQDGDALVGFGDVVAAEAGFCRAGRYCLSRLLTHRA